MHYLWFCQTWGILQLAVVRTGKRSRTYGGTGTRMQRDQEITKQVIESLKCCPCQQDQQELVKQQTPTSSTSQHFLTLAALGSAGSSSCTSLPSLSLAAPSSPCWHCLWTISTPEAALQGLTTACRKWYNCKDFVVVVKILKTSRTKIKKKKNT